MRTLTAEAFHETVTYCFTKVLETMGVSVREVVYAHLNKKGITEADVCTKFDEVFKVLTESFGGSARIIVYKTITELFQQYSSRVDFTYQDPLRVQFFALQERVIADHLLPRRTQGPSVDMYDTVRTLVPPAPLARSG